MGWTNAKVIYVGLRGWHWSERLLQTLSRKAHALMRFLLTTSGKFVLVKLRGVYPYHLSTGPPQTMGLPLASFPCSLHINAEEPWSRLSGGATGPFTPDLPLWPEPPPNPHPRPDLDLHLVGPILTRFRP